MNNIEIRDKRNGDWYWIHRNVYEVYAKKIGAVGLAIYNAYCSYARDKGNAWPSQTTIASKLGISVPTLVKFNAVLERERLIKVYSGKNRGVSNTVFLLKVKGLKEVKTPSKRRLDPGLNVVKTNDKNVEGEEKNDIAAGAAEDRFKDHHEFADYLDGILENENTQPHIYVITLFVTYKGINPGEQFQIQSKKEYSAVVSRYARSARRLVKVYDIDKIDKTMQMLSEHAPFDWTLENVEKYITYAPEKAKESLRAIRKKVYA